MEVEHVQVAPITRAFRLHVIEYLQVALRVLTVYWFSINQNFPDISFSSYNPPIFFGEFFK